jgi:2-dehydro-3-deoxygluconokinase
VGGSWIVKSDAIANGKFDKITRLTREAVETFPNLKVTGTTLRSVKTAGINGWEAIYWADGIIYEATMRENLEIFDRVGGGDSFASGLIYGFITTGDPQQAVEYGAAHGALAMTTPGDTTMARLSEVEKIMAGGGARVDR